MLNFENRGFVRTMRWLIILFLLLPFRVDAQGPRVPSVIQFADMELKLHDQVRKEIQTEVDALHRSPKYFNIKLERVNLYFPIIERILREENVPDDFKYLVIQESALVSDAVSTSNAVGFWQFKIPSAQEVGLRVDSNIDERLNITASTHGAAKYLKRNNFYFNNWIYALLAYNMGVGGANSVVNDKNFGEKKMMLNRRTHWYIVKFLAHKVAFENYVTESNKRLYEYTDGGGQNLKQIATGLGVDYNDLMNYNKWLKKGKVPEDRLYWVIIPGLSSPPVQAAKVIPQAVRSEDATFVSPNSALYPKIKVGNSDSRIVKVNGIPGVIANDGEDLKTLALIGGLELSKFLRINETDISHQVVAGNVYYFKSKKSKAGEHYHTVLHGEDLWMISQKYGVKVQKLMVKNRLEQESDIKPGMILWLRYIRSADQPVEYVQLPPLVEEPGAVVIESGNTGSAEVQDLPAISEQSMEPKDGYTQEPVDEYTQIVEEKEARPEIVLAETTNTNTDEEVEALSVEELEELDKQKAPLFHTVESGETLYSISRKYGVELNDIYRINDLSPDDKIGIGQKIYLSPPFDEIEDKNENSDRDSYMNYTVKKGDTLYSISKKYNASVDDLLKWNNKTDNSLQVGEIIRIKSNK